jgi:hypothetical protein
MNGDPVTEPRVTQVATRIAASIVAARKVSDAARAAADQATADKAKAAAQNGKVTPRRG